jgi:predicted enzyme related to lactoylglutathione lyase
LSCRADGCRASGPPASRALRALECLWEARSLGSLLIRGGSTRSHRRTPSAHERFYADTLGLRADEHAQFEFWAGDTCLGIWEPARFGTEFAPQKNAHLALHVDDVADARGELEAKGVTFVGETLDTGVCHMAFFTDPDGNDLMLHHRYAPQ